MDNITIETINVRLPTEVVGWLDSLVKRGIYKSRSEAIRDFSRAYVDGKRGASDE